MTEEKAAPMFQEHLLTKIHTLVELPISHGLIERMQTLESLLPHFEVREFQYSDLRDLVVSRNSMLALWMYLMKYIDQISVLKFQELAYRMIRALLMRKEFYLGSLGFASNGSAEATDQQRDDEKKVCRIYRKLLVETFLYAASILPLCLGDPQSRITAEEAAAQAAASAAAATGNNFRAALALARDTAELDRPACVRRFCTNVFAFAFLRIPAIQGPVIETLTWRQMNQQEAIASAAQRRAQSDGSGGADSHANSCSSSSSSSSSSSKNNHTSKNDDVLSMLTAATAEVVRFPKGRKVLDGHRAFMDDNPQLFAWPLLASPDDAAKAVPEDPSWLYSLGRDGLVYTDFFLNYTRQVLEMAVCPNGEKKQIPWLALPGYQLFLELYTPLLQIGLLDSVSAAATANTKTKKSGGSTTVTATSVVAPGATGRSGSSSSSSSGSSAHGIVGKPSDAAALEQRWVDKFAPQEQPRPSSYQIAQVMEMGFSRAEALVVLVCTATVSSEFERSKGAADASGQVPAKYMINLERAIDYALAADLKMQVEELGGAAAVEHRYNTTGAIAAPPGSETSSGDVSSGSSSGSASAGAAAAAGNNSGHEDEDLLGDLLDFSGDGVSSAAVPVMSPFGISTSDNNNGLSNSDGVGAGSEWYATGGTSGNVYNNSNSSNDAAAAVAEDAAATAACAATIANLESQKASAVASEDYMRAAALKAEIAKVMEVETTRHALMRQHKQARAEAAAAAQAAAQAAAVQEAARVQAQNDAAAAAAATAATGSDTSNVGSSSSGANGGNLLGVEEDLLGLSDATAVPVAADYSLLPPPVPASASPHGQEGSAVDTISSANNGSDGKSEYDSTVGVAMKEAELLSTWVDGVEEVASTYHLGSKPQNSSSSSDNSSGDGGGVGGSKQRKALTDAIVVGSGVCLASNPKLLPMHAFSLFSALKALRAQHSQGGSSSGGGAADNSGGGLEASSNSDSDDNDGEKLMVAAGAFVMEVLGRWFHQASTRELGMLGAISVKIWVVPLSTQHHACLVHELEHLLEAALAQDAHEAPGGNATKVLKQIITFLYHNVDLIHGAPRHRLLNMILQVGFLRLFLNHSKEVTYGFHLLLVYKLLRFHRHHAGSASDVELLTTHGGPILKLNQLKIIETLKAVADRKTAAADPWKGTRPDGSPIEVEDLDIDRALQSQAHIFLDTIKAAPQRDENDDDSDAAAASRIQAAADHAQAASLAAAQAARASSSSAAAAAEPEDLLCLDAPLDAHRGSNGSDAAAQAAALAQAAEEDMHAKARAAGREAAARAEAVEARVAVPKSKLPLVGPAMANFVRQLWDYYVAGLKAKNDLALSIFAPPLVWAKAYAAFAPSQPIFIPGVTQAFSSLAVSGFQVLDSRTGTDLGRRVQHKPYSDEG